MKNDKVDIIDENRLKNVVIFEEITGTDIHNLADLYRELTGNETDIQAITGNFDSVSRDKNYILLGARISDRLAGSVMGVVCRDLSGQGRPFLVIENLVVSEGYRGRGIGRQLLLLLEEIARDRGCYYMILVSGAEREEAHKLYESLGFGNNPVRGYRKFI